MLFRRIGLLLVVFLCLFPVTALAQEAIIEENNLNVRSGPGTDNERVGQVNAGESYEILEEEEEWVKIQLEGITGWVTKEFVTITGSSNSGELMEEETKETVSIENVTIQVDGTHLRTGASTDFEITGFAEKDQEFEVLSETDNWLEISNGELSGFVLRSHVEPKAGNQNAIKNKTIVIDPGHGGRDVGAIGINDSFEKDITALTAKELKKELTALGAEVIVTRENDEFVPLEARATLANALDTDAFLSIHYNSFPEVPSVTGIETFYYHDQYDLFAEMIHEEIIKETGERDRGIAAEDFHVTRQTFKPGLLLELGFLSNKENDALLHTTGYQKKMVTGIIKGLQRYFNEQ